MKIRITKLLIAASLITLLGIGCVKTATTNTNANTNANLPTEGLSPDKPASRAFTVKIAPDGEFDPVTAYVTVGTTVTFVNTSTKPHGIEPYADAGKKFDALATKTDLAPGQKFSVMFDQSGRWFYSDRTNVSFGGAIDVAYPTALGKTK